MNRKIICAMLLSILLLLVGCGQDTKPAPPSTPEAVPSASYPVIPEASDAPPETTSPDKEILTSSDILVAYFSATGTTEQIAGWIAGQTGGVLYQITPETPYTPEDLDYGDDSSRATVEQNDSSARPAISGMVDNMEGYDTVFLGYPIWFGQAPRIISTFLESYDLSGKTIVPFCTSGSSGIGSSDTNLHGLASDSANWLPGERFSANTSQGEIQEWIISLNIPASTPQEVEHLILKQKRYY